jgi:putative ABC transport system permease protein
MRQVGMTDREIGASIRTQVLLVFFLPLLAAGLHTAMAFPMLSKMLYLFQIQDTGAFALCTAGTFLVFCVIYTIVYALTARAYGRIVGQRGA